MLYLVYTIAKKSLYKCNNIFYCCDWIMGYQYIALLNHLANGKQPKIHFFYIGTDYFCHTDYTDVLIDPILSMADRPVEPYSASICVDAYRFAGSM